MGGCKEKLTSRATHRYLTWVTVEMDDGSSQEDKRSKRPGRKRKIRFRRADLRAPRGHPDRAMWLATDLLYEKAAWALGKSFGHFLHLQLLFSPESKHAWVSVLKGEKGGVKERRLKREKKGGRRKSDLPTTTLWSLSPLWIRAACLSPPAHPSCSPESPLH